MTTQLQLRRGTAAQNDAFTGAEGEVTVDTTNKTLRVHDGTTQGGFPVARSADTAKTDMSNLTSTGKNIGLWCDNAANIIAEIPQDINLTLSSGTLTLKAGSKVYVPNGAGVFDAVSVSSDTTYTQSGSSSDGQYLMFYSSGGIAKALLTDCASGSSEPSISDYGFWYDTTNNKIKRKISGSFDAGGYALPLCIITVSSNAISSIDQVFNGFGFIGDRIFVLPGVKIAIPNGRNADGTLKNKIETVPTVRTTNQIHTSAYMLNAAGITPAPNIRYAEQTTQPSFANGNWYNPDTNFMYNISSGAVTTSNSMCALYVETTTGSYGGSIVHLTPKSVFRAVGYTETDYISHQSMPSEKYINVTLGASGTTYTAPADGYYTVLKQATGSGEYLFFIDETNTMNMGIFPPAGTNGRCIFPVSKGEVIKVNYTLTGTTVHFRFVYANGAK